MIYVELFDFNIEFECHIVIILIIISIKWIGEISLFNLVEGNYAFRRCSSFQFCTRFWVKLIPFRFVLFPILYNYTLIRIVVKLYRAVIRDLNVNSGFVLGEIDFWNRGFKLTLRDCLVNLNSFYCRECFHTIDFLNLWGYYLRSLYRSTKGIFSTEKAIYRSINSYKIILCDFNHVFINLDWLHWFHRWWWCKKKSYLHNFSSQFFPIWICVWVSHNLM